MMGKAFYSILNISVLPHRKLLLLTAAFLSPGVKILHDNDIAFVCNGKVHDLSCDLMRNVPVSPLCNIPEPSGVM